MSAGVLGKVPSSSDSKPTTIYDFGGPFNQTTIGAGAGPSVAVDVYSDPSNPNIVGGGVTIGPGVGTGASQTRTNTVCDLSCWLNKIFPKPIPNVCK